MTYTIKLSEDQRQLLLAAVHVYRREARGMQGYMTLAIYRALQWDLEHLRDILEPPFSERVENHAEDNDRR